MFSRDVLKLDLEREAADICAALREKVTKVLLRRGLVVGVSGGIDSSTTLGLAVEAFGPQRVFGLLMPERDSSGASVELGTELCEHLGVEYAVENIQPTLAAIGCYKRYDEAIRRVFPQYGPGWKSKIVLPGDLLNSDRINVYRVVVEDPEGQRHDARLPVQAYLEIVAATNFKQRIRKTLEYYHADRLNYAVAGTPNRLEYDQGFFVKNGDGSADVKPIAHLYKSQVYAMAWHLGLPRRICDSTPTTDTYSLAQGQDEFYFVLPYAEMDLLLWARNHGVAPQDAAGALGLTADQVQRVYRDIDRKRATTRPLQLPPLLVKDVPEIDKG
ncbi:MAG TPA: NAD(+) synthase [Candidatus Krumholzibacteria bacterium]|nr:NAD(+) synthase [Candidatus Krumholzibacteria bacterium]HPD72305.1 NAD(+) synthase [Candidatus Krumholzibacteria bacterium]HRY40763.1 NAD(+) synthase [Candidatus Krumholzibacteria bacterium]